MHMQGCQSLSKFSLPLEFVQDPFFSIQFYVLLWSVINSYKYVPICFWKMYIAICVDKKNDAPLPILLKIYIRKSNNEW